MSDPFPILNRAKRYQYDPNAHSYCLGQACGVCSRKIIYHEAISACKCYSFSHERCLLSQLNPTGAPLEQRTYCCKICKHELITGWTSNLEIDVFCQLRNLIGCILCNLIALASVLSILLANIKVNQPWRLLLILATFFWSLTFGIMFFANLFVRRRVIITRVITTSMELKISAFENLEELKEDESTQTEMIKV